MKNFNWNFVLAIVAGLATMMVIVAGIEYIGHMLYPPEETLDYKNKEAMTAFMASAPVLQLIFVPIAWIFGAMAGAFVGGLICPEKKRHTFFIVAIFTLLAGVMNMIMIPSPWYFWVLAAFIFPGALLGSRLVPVK